jgi:hypothetical protein
VKKTENIFEKEAAYKAEEGNPGPPPDNSPHDGYGEMEPSKC